MKSYLSAINKIKKEFDNNWLTDSQRKVFDKLKDHFSFYGSITGFLYGPPGCGKTFIGWVLEKEGILEYIPGGMKSKYNFSSTVKGVVIDNIDFERYRLRDVMKNIALDDINRYLLIGRFPPDEKLMREFKLNLRRDDLIKARENLKNIGCSLHVNIENATSFWSLLKGGY
ncbi:MAG: hypothetical protein K8T10_16000 [Candidatus Eremiobacteraeota bacterium]|nr:hypothetical protein [Candidatus Eremiobacteraeota bacterium]